MMHDELSSNRDSLVRRLTTTSGTSSCGMSGPCVADGERESRFGASALLTRSELDCFSASRDAEKQPAAFGRTRGW